MQIVWDPEKAKENRSKHGVAFPDAEPVLFDPHAITREDGQAEGEQRFVTVGLGCIGPGLGGCLHISGRDDPADFSQKSDTKREQSV